MHWGRNYWILTVLYCIKLYNISVYTHTDYTCEDYTHIGLHVGIFTSCIIFHSSVSASLCETTWSHDHSETYFWQLVHLLYPIGKQQRAPSTTTWYNLLQMIKTGSYISGPSPLVCFDDIGSFTIQPGNIPPHPHLLTGVWQSNLHQAVERRPIETMETRIVSRCEAHVKPWLLNGPKFQGSSCWKMTWKYIQS